MKTIITLQILLFLTAIFPLGQNLTAQQQSKEINKVFQINKGDILRIENKFGDIDILQWDKAEISVSVNLSANSRNADAANKMIEKISIDIKKENNTINAVTFLNNESEMSHGNSFAVNYKVYVPKWANLNLTNKFGNIHMDDISGTVNIELKHGNLNVKSLGAGNASAPNEIIMAYSNGVIENAGSVKLELSFSKMEIEEAETISSETKYSVINVGSCRSFKSESKYDNFKFENIRNVEGSLQYSNLHINAFSGKFDMESTYSGVKIDEVLPSFESIKIINTRGPYKIGIGPEVSFDLYADSDDGEINVGEFEVIEKRTEGSHKFIRAINGTQGTGKVINITVEDGSVSVFKK
jgi:hypothetical protein